MVDEISQAFAHPEARAAAQTNALPDRISLRDHIVSVEIGAFQVERGVQQRLAFNVVVEVTTPDENLADDVDKILSYDKLTQAIADELAAERLNLLETLAERIATRILQEPQAKRVFLRIEKLDRGPGALGVEIVREAKAMTQAPRNPVRPLVVHLSAQALEASKRPGALAQIQADERPTIVTVGAPLPMRGADPEVQKRIDLLALEQSAWALSGRMSGASVAATRTELDWAIGQGLTCIWAPSKMVLDAVDGLQGPVDALALAKWFAGEMQAAEFVVVDPADLA